MSQTTRRDVSTVVDTAPLEPTRGQRHLTIVNPLDGSPVGSIAIATDQDIAAALTAARKAAPAWAAVDPAQRGTALSQMAEALELHAAELAELNTRETGKPDAEARGGIA